HDVLIGLVFIAAHDSLPGDFTAGVLVVPLVTDRREIVPIEQAEAQLIGPDGGPKSDRNFDQAEAQTAFPKRAIHGNAPLDLAHATSGALFARQRMQSPRHAAPSD